MKNKVVLVSTWGLPGSGKTTFADNFKGGLRSKTYVVSYDNLPGYYNDKDKPSGFIRRISEYLTSGFEKIIADSLITTNEQFINFINQIKNVEYFKSIEIQYWIPDVEACLWNDKYRRSTNSEITIKNTVIEEPNIELIKTGCPKLKDIEITVVKNRVVRKERWKMFADKNNIRHNDGVVKSDSWSLGGTYGNCWNDTKHQVSGEPQPASFFEFDNLLESVCPNITFLQYKKLYNACVSTDTRGESDYYGGHVEYGFYQFNVKHLFDELVNLGIINYEEL